MRYILILFLAIICSVSYAGTRDPSKKDEAYVEYGSKFSCIFKLKCETTNGMTYYGSAVAIDDHWLLTAAHVLTQAKDIKIIVGNNTIKVDRMIAHKNFVQANYGLYDIALCHSEQPLNLDFYPQFYTKEDEVGKICSISGFGSFGTFETGAISSDNKRRAGSNKIDIIDRHMLICTASRPSSKDTTELEFISASGDSGGGLFIDGKLAGINSCVMAIDKKTDSNYGDEAGHTRVSQFVEWIKENKR